MLVYLSGFVIAWALLSLISGETERLRQQHEALEKAKKAFAQAQEAASQETETAKAA